MKVLPSRVLTKLNRRGPESRRSRQVCCRTKHQYFQRAKLIFIHFEIKILFSHQKFVIFKIAADIYCIIIFQNFSFQQFLKTELQQVVISLLLNLTFDRKVHFSTYNNYSLFLNKVHALSVVFSIVFTSCQGRGNDSVDLLPRSL